MLPSSSFPFFEMLKVHEVQIHANEMVIANVKTFLLFRNRLYMVFSFLNFKSYLTETFKVVRSVSLEMVIR